MKDYYSLLGVARGAPEENIKKAFPVICGRNFRINLPKPVCITSCFSSQFTYVNFVVFYNHGVYFVACQLFYYWPILRHFGTIFRRMAQYNVTFVQ